MSIFKECDVRGVWGEDIDAAIAYRIGRAVAALHPGTMAVAGDVRLSTPELKTALIQGLREGGNDVIDIGMTPTPVFYYALGVFDVAGGVMVTASHNPAKFNGFKFMFGNLPVTPEDVRALEIQIEKPLDAPQNAALTQRNIDQQYMDAMQALTPPSPPLKIVVDAGNGATGILAPTLLRRLGHEVVELFCDFDGRFPNREPNPAVHANLDAVRAKVLETHAALGVSFDGDGDRVVFIDEQGRAAASEEALILLCREYLKTPSSLVYDIKSSGMLAREVAKLGSKPIMERSGHAFIKRTFLHNHSALAGEISGHFFFRELGHDDGMYAAARMASLLAREGWKLGEQTDRLVKPVITPDLRIPWPTDEQQRVLDAVERLPGEISRLDGIRVQFENGWLLARKSVTEPCVTIRLEGEIQKDVDEMIVMLLEALPELRGKHRYLEVE